MKKNVIFKDKKTQLHLIFHSLLILFLILSSASAFALNIQSTELFESSSEQTNQEASIDLEALGPGQLIQDKSVSSQDDTNHVFQKQYGPVKNNEGLWEIADKLRLNFQTNESSDTNTDLTTPQIAVALFEKNPHSFINLNINGILVGSTLDIPDKNQIQQLNKSEAFDQFLLHWEVWQGNASFEIDAQESEDNILPVLQAIVQTQVKTSAQIPVHTPDVTEAGIPPQDKIITAQLNPTPDVLVIKEKIIHEQKISEKKVLPLFTQTKFELFLNNSQNNFNEMINWLQSLHRSTFFKESILLKQPAFTPILIILLSLIVFTFIFWLFRREETEFLEITTSAHQSQNKLFSDDDLLNQKTTDEKLIIETKVETKVITETTTITDVEAESAEVKTFTASGKKNMLEFAFGDNISSYTSDQNQKEIKTQSATEEQPETEMQYDLSDIHLLDSFEQIRFVNGKIKDSKVSAFMNATQSDTLSEEMLSHDFDKIMDSNKIDIFIQEFEEVMSSLTDHTPDIDRTYVKLDNLIQFKLSINFIKILSEMMQANHLKQFSTTIIEFLEDVLDGKAKITSDTSDRLIFVVSFYNHYICSLKEFNKDKIEA